MNTAAWCTQVNLRTASEKISASLRYARSQATSKKTTYEALFDFANNRLSIGIQEVSDETHESDVNDNDEGVARSKSYDLPDGVRFEKAILGQDEIVSDLFQILIFSQGSSSGGEVILINDRARRSKLAVDFITGTVKLSEVEED